MAAVLPTIVAPCGSTDRLSGTYLSHNLAILFISPLIKAATMFDMRAMPELDGKLVRTPG